MDEGKGDDMHIDMRASACGGVVVSLMQPYLIATI